MKKNILITGAAGFIGSNFAHYFSNKYSEYNLIILDKLTYAGNLHNLDKIKDKITFIQGDICDFDLVMKIFKDNNINGVIHFAAESHVDNSIKTPFIFTQTNVIGTHTLLEVATRINPNSPYSASKASSDLIARAYYETFKMNVNITNCSNNYGAYQHHEKLIPHMISLALKDEKLPVYGDGRNIRDWLYVEDHCKAIDIVFHKGEKGERYNIGGHNEKRNIDIVKLILKHLGKEEDLIEHVTDRKGHDYRYAIDPTKIKEKLGWEPETKFEDGIIKTIDWYLEHKEYLDL